MIYLNSEKIRWELGRIHKTQKWLAKKLWPGKTENQARSLLNYHLKAQSVRHAGAIGDVLGLDFREITRIWRDK